MKSDWLNSWPRGKNQPEPDYKWTREEKDVEEEDSHKGNN